MADRSKTMLLGNAGTDGDMKYTGNGTPCTTFRMGVNRKYQKNGEEVQDTDWFGVVCFGKVAEIAQHIKKGMRIYVEGRVGLKTYESQDSQFHSSLELRANDIVIEDRYNGGSKFDDEEEPF